MHLNRLFDHDTYGPEASIPACKILSAMSTYEQKHSIILLDAPQKAQAKPFCDMEPNLPFTVDDLMSLIAQLHTIPLPSVHNDDGDGDGDLDDKQASNHPDE